MVMSTCGKIKYNIIACLTGKQQYLSKFSSSKSLITPFVKILHYQIVVPYGTTHVMHLQLGATA